MCKTEAEIAEQQCSSLNADIATAVFRYLTGEDDMDAEQETSHSTADRKQVHFLIGDDEDSEQEPPDASARNIDTKHATANRNQESESAEEICLRLAPPPGDFSQAYSRLQEELVVQPSGSKLQAKEPMPSSSLGQCLGAARSGFEKKAVQALRRRLLSRSRPGFEKKAVLQPGVVVRPTSMTRELTEVPVSSATSALARAEKAPDDSEKALEPESMGNGASLGVKPCISNAALQDMQQSPELGALGSPLGTPGSLDQEPMPSLCLQQHAFVDPDLQRGQLVLETLQAGFEELEMPCTLSSWELAYYDQALSLSIRQLFAANLMPTLALVRECLRAKGIPEDQLEDLLKIVAQLSPRYCLWAPKTGPICVVIVEEQQLADIHPDRKEQLEKQLALAATNTFSKKFGCSFTEACRAKLQLMQPESHGP